MRKLFQFIVLMFAIGGATHAATITGRITAVGLNDHSNAVVYIDKIPGMTFPPPRQPVILDQRNLKFEPHVLPVLMGTRVIFPNSDEIRHNVFSPTANQRFNVGNYPAGEIRERVFDRPGPVTLLCNVHLEMSAYVVVVETPYFASSAEDGGYRIAEVPPGNYTLQIWHPRLKTQTRQITITGDETVTLNVELRK